MEVFRGVKSSLADDSVDVLELPGVVVDSGAPPLVLLSSAATRPAMGKSWVSLLKVKFSWRSRWIARVGIRRTCASISYYCYYPALQHVHTWLVDLDQFLDEIPLFRLDHHSACEGKVAIKPWLI